MLLLAGAIYLVDVMRVGRGGARWAGYTPLLVFGTNSILAYMISELGDSLLRAIHLESGVSLRAAAFHGVSAVVTQPGWASLLNSVGFMLLCWLLVLPFYLKRMFLRI
jgi:predicted acyltransferase